MSSCGVRLKIRTNFEGGVNFKTSFQVFLVFVSQSSITDHKEFNLTTEKGLSIRVFCGLEKHLLFDQQVAGQFPKFFDEWVPHTLQDSRLLRFGVKVDRSKQTESKDRVTGGEKCTLPIHTSWGGLSLRHNA